MNYSFQNPYGAYPYNPYGNSYVNQQPTQQQQSQQTMQQQYLPLAVINTKEDIERFIVQPNGAVFLYSEQLKILCIKRADNIGRFSYEVFNLSKEDNNQNNNKYALQSDLQILNEKINEIYKKLEGNTNNE